MSCFFANVIKHFVATSGSAIPHKVLRGEEPTFLNVSSSLDSYWYVLFLLGQSLDLQFSETHKVCHDEIKLCVFFFFWIILLLRKEVYWNFPFVCLFFLLYFFLIRNIIMMNGVKKRRKTSGDFPWAFLYMVLWCRPLLLNLKPGFSLL